MHDRRDDRDDRDRRRGHGEERRSHDRSSPRQRSDDSGGDRDGARGGGPDTRFLQLEMSEVLYAEAESVTKQALRELLLEECKVRFRERFGDQITGLAQLAVDELMQEIFASLDIEARIRQQNQEHEGRRDRLSDILRAGRDGAAEGEEETCGEGSPEPNGEGGGGSGSESDQDR